MKNLGSSCITGPTVPGTASARLSSSVTERTKVGRVRSGQKESGGGSGSGRLSARRSKYRRCASNGNGTSGRAGGRRRQRRRQLVRACGWLSKPKHRPFVTSFCGATGSRADNATCASSSHLGRHFRYC